MRIVELPTPRQDDQTVLGNALRRLRREGAPTGERTIANLPTPECPAVARWTSYLE